MPRRSNVECGNAAMRPVTCQNLVRSWRWLRKHSALCARQPRTMLQRRIYHCSMRLEAVDLRPLDPGPCEKANLINEEYDDVFFDARC